MRSSLFEQRRLMGLESRYDWTTEQEAPTSPSSPEDDMDVPITPKPDDEDPPNVQGQGDTKAWDMYRTMEEEAKEMAEKAIEMWEKLNVVTEDEMSRESRRSLKSAKLAVREAVAAQKNAYRRISEFGSTLMGK